MLLNRGRRLAAVELACALALGLPVGALANSQGNN